MIRGRATLVNNAAAASAAANDEVFRSMQVLNSSKTPYSDATQVMEL